MGLIEITQEEATKKQRKTKAVIERMIADGEIINYYSVSKAADVSRAFLYQHRDIRDLIEDCRLSGISKKELQREIIQLRRRVRKLEHEPKQ